MGATAMTITHDMASVRAIADRVAMLHDGTIKWTGTVTEMDTTGDPYVHQFINGLSEGPIAAIRSPALIFKRIMTRPQDTLLLTIALGRILQR